MPGEHKPHQSGVWARGKPPGWDKIRAFVLARDRYTCQLKTKKCTTKAEHVHHIHGDAASPTDPRFLVASCAPCNLFVGDPNKYLGVKIHVPDFLKEGIRNAREQTDG